MEAGHWRTGGAGGYDDEIRERRANPATRRLAQLFGLAMIFLLVGLLVRPASSVGALQPEAEEPGPVLGQLLGRDETVVIIAGADGPRAFRVGRDGRLIPAPEALDGLSADPRTSAVAPRTLMFVDGGWDDFGER